MLERFKRKPALTGLVSALFVIGVILIAIAYDSDGNQPEPFGTPLTGGIRTATATPTITPTSTQPTNTPVPGITPEPTATEEPVEPPTPVPQPSGTSSGDRLFINDFGIDAPLIHISVGPDGVMPDPSDPDRVAIYSFESHPHFGGIPGVTGSNVILSGHVDWGAQNATGCNNSVNVAPAPCLGIFYPINQMGIGDTIQLTYDGETYTYRVQAGFYVPAGTSEAFDAALFAEPGKEVLTLITCGGDFVGGEYTNRYIVQAARVR